MSAGLATFEALQSTLGLEDLYDLIEIVATDRHNQKIAMSKD